MTSKAILPNTVYLSKDTLRLIEEGFTGDKEHLEKSDSGYTLTLEPIIGKSEQELLDAKKDAEQYPLHFQEAWVWDYETKGPRKPVIVKDKVYLGETHDIYDFNGNKVKTIDQFPTKNAFCIYQEEADRVIIRSNEQLFVYDGDFNFLFSTPQFMHKKKLMDVRGQYNINLASESMIVCHGSNYGKAFLVKYNLAGEVVQEKVLQRGFIMVASAAEKDLCVTRHKTSGVFAFHDTDFEVTKEATLGKKYDVYRISPDGKFFVAGGMSLNELVILNLETGVESRMEVHPFGKEYRHKKGAIKWKTKAVRFSPDSKQMLVTGDKYLLRRIDLETLETNLLTRPDHSMKGMFYSGVEGVNFRNDFILSGASDYLAFVHNQNNEVQAVLAGHSGTVYWVDSNADMSVIVTGAVDGTSRLWKR